VVVCVVATSSVNLSQDCFVLTQDDVRGNSRGDSRSDNRGDSGHYTSADDLSAPLRRSAHTNVTRHKSLMPVAMATDTAAASTWLDEVRESDDDEMRMSRARLTADTATQRQQDYFDFHFALASASQSSQQEAAASSVNHDSRPVALVQPHKVTGVRVMPTDLNASLASWSQGKQTKSSATSDSTADHAKSSTDVTSLRDQIKATPAVVSRRNITTATPSAAASKPPVVTQRPLSARPSVDPAVSQLTSKETRPSVDPTVTGAGQNHQQLTSKDKEARASVDPAVTDALSSKDKEIASAIGDMRLDYTQNTLSAHGTNFEKCLGYFP